jgi:hypothetical protein
MGQGVRASDPQLGPQGPKTGALRQDDGKMMPRSWEGPHAQNANGKSSIEEAHCAIV